MTSIILNVWDIAAIKSDRTPFFSVLSMQIDKSTHRYRSAVRLMGRFLDAKPHIYNVDYYFNDNYVTVVPYMLLKFSIH